MSEYGSPKPWVGITRGQVIAGGLIGVLLVAGAFLIAIFDEGTSRWIVVSIFGAYGIFYIVILFLYLTHRIKRKD